jgi:hypothetical protein
MPTQQQPDLQPHPHIRKGEFEKEFETQFLEFKKVYPKRKGSMGWHDARKKLKRVCAETPFEIILAAAREYAGELRTRGKLESEFVKMPATWLNQCCYADYAEQQTERKRLLEEYQSQFVQ